ncbi:helitron_like_N domain-containing protein [Nephila pilipes]|uniref:Helitron_like_N domain-containing protein n=1 Tax=Nephila pilipes TaxID=299642 RepID=A0A8X6R3Q8_NEPPI|nr:helitron_like_N domain-containing protein [Nephila pilipes]
MPPKKSNLNNARSREARHKYVERSLQSAEEITARKAAKIIRTAGSRARESRKQQRKRQWTSRSLTCASFVRLAFEYAPDINYSAHSKIAIGAIDKVCRYCQALKFQKEALGICCASGNVIPSPIPTPPEPLLSLLAGNSDDSKLFLRKIRKFNSCFQMTSFGTTKICDLASVGRNFEEREERVTTRCQYNFIEQADEREIIVLLESFFLKIGITSILITTISSMIGNSFNCLKKMSPELKNDHYQIVIKVDKVPLGAHVGRYKAPTVGEVVVIMVDDQVDNRVIKITCHYSTVSAISDLHVHVIHSNTH